MARRKGKTRLPWTREDRRLTVDEVRWLRSVEARDVCSAMAAGDPADTPSAIARWRQRIEAEKVRAAWHQVVLRQAARTKFSRADDMLFDRVGLEQATDEVVAAHKARRFAGFGRVADLCCGIGGDTLALAGLTRVAAVDWSAVRTVLTEHNVSVYGGAVEVHADDAVAIRLLAEAAHIDPDRRAEGLRRHDPDAGSPNVEELHQIVARYVHVAIKMSPGADFTVLPIEGEIELISHRGECKQAVLWTGSLAGVQRRATVLPAAETITASRREETVWPDPAAVLPGDVLHEPDPAVIRAGLVGNLARRCSLSPIDPQIAYLVGREPAATAMLTPFRVIDVLEWSHRKARQWLASHDIGGLDIKTRGFAAHPEDIQRGLRLKGSHHAVLFLTRIHTKAMAILAERIDTAATVSERKQE